MTRQETGARLFNCCTGNAAPDWTRFARLEIGGCIQDPDSAGHIIGGQNEAEAEFFTIYGRLHDGMAEAITDCGAVADARAVGQELADLSGLQVCEMFVAAV